MEERSEIMRMIGEDLARITAIDPSVTSLEDLMALPGADAMKQYMAMGLDLYEAWFLTEKENILARAVEAELARRGSKAHLRASESRGTGGEGVPPEQLELFRRLYPGEPEDEYIRYYRKYRKSKA